MSVWHQAIALLFDIFVSPVPHSATASLPKNGHGNHEHWTALSLPALALASILELLAAAKVQALALAALMGDPYILVRSAALSSVVSR